MPEGGAAQAESGTDTERKGQVEVVDDKVAHERLWESFVGESKEQEQEQEQE